MKRYFLPLLLIPYTSMAFGLCEPLSDQEYRDIMLGKWNLPFNLTLGPIHLRTVANIKPDNHVSFHLMFNGKEVDKPNHATWSIRDGNFYISNGEYENDETGGWRFMCANNSKVKFAIPTDQNGGHQEIFFERVI